MTYHFTDLQTAAKETARVVRECGAEISVSEAKAHARRVRRDAGRIAMKYRHYSGDWLTWTRDERAMRQENRKRYGL